MLRRMTPRQALCRLAAAAALLPASAGLAVPLMELAAVPPSGLPAAWQLVGLPQQHKPFTQYQVVQFDGQAVLRVAANASYGNLVHALPPGTPAGRLAWRWRLDEANPRTDLHRRAGDDSAVKVCASFDLPDRAVPFIERQLMRLARLRSGQPLPAATLCYVWDPQLPTGAVLDNAYTRRVRLMVLRGEGSALHTWVTEQRDLRADFLRLFGDEAAEAPPLQAIVLSADADNTQGHSLAHVSELSLE
jgi:hypothetical protein